MGYILHNKKKIAYQINQKNTNVWIIFLETIPYPPSMKHIYNINIDACCLLFPFDLRLKKDIHGRNTLIALLYFQVQIGNRERLSWQHEYINECSNNIHTWSLFWIISAWLCQVICHICTMLAHNITFNILSPCDVPRALPYSIVWYNNDDARWCVY